LTKGRQNAILNRNAPSLRKVKKNRRLISRNTTNWNGKIDGRERSSNEEGHAVMLGDHCKLIRADLVRRVCGVDYDFCTRYT
jgi:hypothetical protein